MTTPDSKEAPERVECPFCGHDDPQWTMLAGRKYATVSCGKCHARGPTVPFDMRREPIYTTIAPAFAAWNQRADLVNRDPSEGDVERVAKALGREETGLDDESLDGLVWHPSSNSWRVPDMPRWKQWEDAARAAINAWRNP